MDSRTLKSRILMSIVGRDWICDQVDEHVAEPVKDHGLDLQELRKPYLYHKHEHALVAELGGYPITLPYSGKTATQPGDFDVDHIVSLEEVAESGGAKWSKGQWDTYQGDPFCLMLADPKINRDAKRAKDCAHWLPPQHIRWFLGDVAMIKLAYHLTFSPDEAKVIRANL